MFKHNKDETLNVHNEYCKQMVGQAQIAKNPIIVFDRFESTELIPLYYVLDFESALKPIHELGKNYKIHRHVCASYSWVCIGTNGHKVARKSFLQRNENDNPTKQAIQEMLEDIQIRGDKIKESQTIAKNRMRYSLIDTKDVLLGNSEKLKKCALRGYAHLKCNNKCQIAYKFRCVLIGGSNYDNKLICQVLHHRNMKNPHHP